MMWYFSYHSPIGKLTIYEEDGFISKIEFGNREISQNTHESELISKCYSELVEYFKGERKEFDLPLAPKGTEFQKKVWNALLKIPYGETRSYKDIAISIGNEKGCRAVGGANNKNPIPIIIPCHRVIGINSKLVGYAGGLEIKSYLLNLEAKHLGKL